ncbi:restriction endonuclease subunit S [Arthrobacter celericrescens]|uniref:restriction endonuclease subunit S n=1 Tax=Arthrobacter celericrescens TaxID=2320851 RepID=UPI000EA13FD3|nr:restriction endonuclease subunit S [Arthrobacter celericrescens]
MIGNVVLRPVRQLSDLVTKGTTPTSLGRPFVARGVTFIKVETIASDGEFIAGKEAFIDYETHGLLRRSQLQTGDILFSIAGALGRTTVVKPEWLPANTNQAFAIIRPSKRNNVCSRYLLWQLRGSMVQRRIVEINVQAAQANLSLEQVRDFEIPIIARKEQARIADALDDIDALASGLERLISKKRSIKQGMMQQLLTGQTRLPGFSGDWTSLHVASNSTLRARIGWQGLTADEYRFDGEHRLVGGTEFSDGRVDWSRTPFVDRWRYDQDSGIQLREGDVLLTKDGTIGKTAFVDELPGPCTLNSGVFVIRPTKKAYDSHFLYYMLRSRSFDEFLSRLTAGSTISHLYQRDLVGLVLDVPPTLEEQHAIVKTLYDADAELGALRARLSKAQSLKQGMMQELLTGRTRLQPVEASS